MISLLEPRFLSRYVKDEDDLQSSSSKPTTFANNREKYKLRGFEDESGDCRVCGAKYKSLFEHVELDSHVSNYNDHLNGAVNIKLHNAGRPVESCRQFVNRHMSHLEKRCQLIS